jgi:hypothetical protein
VPSNNSEDTSKAHCYASSVDLCTVVMSCTSLSSIHIIRYTLSDPRSSVHLRTTLVLPLRASESLRECRQGRKAGLSSRLGNLPTHSSTADSSPVRIIVGLMGGSTGDCCNGAFWLLRCDIGTYNEDSVYTVLISDDTHSVDEARAPWRPLHAPRVVSCNHVREEKDRKPFCLAPLVAWSQL